MRRLGPMVGLAALLALPTPAGCQLKEDAGTLVIRQHGKEIGVESFRVRPAREGRAVGDSITSSVRYPATRPQVEISVSLERHPSSAFSFQLEYRSPDDSRQVYAGSARSRVTVRQVAKGIESAREFPGGERMVILEDSVFALYLTAAHLATDEGQALTALFPRSGRRVSFTARKIDGSVRAGDLKLQQVRLLGGISGDIYLDQSGRLARVDLPSLGIEASRTRD